MRIKSLWLQAFLLCATMLCNHAAQANIYTYSINATVTSLDQNDLKALYSVGSALTGQFTLDDTKLDVSPGAPGSTYWGSVTQAHFNTGGVSIDVLSGYTGVYYSLGSIAFLAGPLFNVGGTVNANIDVPDWTLTAWALMMGDPNHTMSNNNFPDPSLVTNNGMWRAMYLGYQNQAGELAYVVADVSGIALISAVPEPSSVLMMSAGLLGMLFARRKSQR